jgi:hypothetical protein
MTYRNLVGATWVKSVSETWASWRLSFLNDDESQLPAEQGAIRGGLAVFMKLGSIGVLADDSWDAIAALQPDYLPYRWDELLVDATELLPAVGPAMLLTYIALEIRIADAADVLASQAKIHTELWQWITAKRPYLAEPTTEEFAKAVFTMLSGKSLADEDELWQTFIDLRKARNSFAHEGTAVDMKGQVVNPERAQQLIAGARRVLDWIEALLPEESHRKTFTATTKLEVSSPPIKND